MGHPAELNDPLRRLRLFRYRTQLRGRDVALVDVLFPPMRNTVRSACLVGCALLAAFLAAPLLPAAPKVRRGPLVEGHEKARPGIDTQMSTRKPPYPYRAIKERSEAVMVLRLFFNRAGRVERVVPLGFRGDRLLLESTSDFAKAYWTAKTNPPRPVYHDIPVVFSHDGKGTWVAEFMRDVRYEGSTDERCAALLEAIRRKARQPMREK